VSYRFRKGDRPGSATTVLAIFVLSGAAGLIYEVFWARQLVLVFGNTTQAVSAILTGSSGDVHRQRHRRADRWLATDARD
jgi:hypothetical protein